MCWLLAFNRWQMKPKSRPNKTLILVNFQVTKAFWKSLLSNSHLLQPKSVQRVPKRKIKSFQTEFPGNQTRQRIEIFLTTSQALSRPRKLELLNYSTVWVFEKENSSHLLSVCCLQTSRSKESEQPGNDWTYRESYNANSHNGTLHHEAALKFHRKYVFSYIFNKKEQFRGTISPLFARHSCFE